MSKTSTLMARVPADVLEEVRQVAQYDGRTLAEEVGEALEILLEARKNDPAFQQRVRAALARGQRFLQDAGEHEVAAKLDVPAARSQGRAGG